MRPSSEARRSSPCSICRSRTPVRNRCVCVCACVCVRRRSIPPTGTSERRRGPRRGTAAAHPRSRGSGGRRRDRPGAATGLRIGDRVVAVASPVEPMGGAYAGSVALPAWRVARAPAGSSHSEAATLPMNGLTARHALDPLGLPRGRPSRSPAAPVRSAATWCRWPRPRDSPWSRSPRRPTRNSSVLWVPIWSWTATAASRGTSSGPFPVACTDSWSPWAPARRRSPPCGTAERSPAPSVACVPLPPPSQGVFSTSPSPYTWVTSTSRTVEMRPKDQ